MDSLIKGISKKINLNKDNDKNNNNNNNNNNNESLPQLSNFLQSHIIKIFCRHINYVNKSIYFTGIMDYRKVEFENNHLILKLALVSRFWFNTLSNNITTCADFNYNSRLTDAIFQKARETIKGGAKIENENDENDENDENKLVPLGKDISLYCGDKESKFSIIKRDNIESIKLHFDSCETISSFYKRVSDTIDITYGESPSKVLLILKEDLKNLKRVIVRNLNLFSDLNRNIFGPTFSNIQLMEFVISPNANVEAIKSFKKINSLIIGTFPIFREGVLQLEQNRNIISDCIKCISGMKQIFVYAIAGVDYFGLSGYAEEETEDNTRAFNIVPITGSINYFKDIEVFECINSVMTFKDLYCLLKATPNLGTLSIGFCIDGLYWLLSEEDGKLSECECCLIPTINEKNEDPMSKEQFQHLFSDICDQLKLKTKLTKIFAHNQCSNPFIPLNEDNYKKFTSFSKNFTKLFLSPPNLIKIGLFGMSKADYINDILITSKNRNIKEFSMDIDREDSALEIVNQMEILTKQYTHIHSLKIYKGAKKYFSYKNKEIK
ncbi:hypothetical protein DICPUDRAFT_76476 [Dictyostelium purpureum]|uniref:Uncharacterized protein n=1 Tax=Dictyostelium purpureum TaxID=5786 RepID=F0ZDQ8_DICPU|nr:uncharacterized protein DICPUDRAFT_76476 [Dictyostelium purpureum]EGC37889.1 hypothetical protein DICPUDRAFT_76476 [Dictyostelium purpureum]|eukprot:XP_003285549.1 hypothetical protein DICPUDRAFT_76476 [Dictyostelium purpureum]